MDPHQREPLPELADRRVRFLTLYVEFADGSPIEVLSVEARMITFDAEGRRDQDDTRRALQAAVGLFDTAFGSSKPTTVVPAAARFQSAGFRWKPTSAEVDAVIAAHRLWSGR